jgi:prolyl-tRNA editing enzyme YbaK/EbsC (Cys-tRNA(Pro) deacylase)
VGGISPFGAKRRMQVFIDTGAMQFERIYVNGGSRGFLVSMSPKDLVDALDAQVANLSS